MGNWVLTLGITYKHFEEHEKHRRGFTDKLFLTLLFLKPTTGNVDSSTHFGPLDSSQTPPITAEENFGSSATQIEDNFGSSAIQDNFGSSATQIVESFVSSATQSTQVSEGRCPDLSKVNVVDDQMYTVNIETFKEDKLTIEMVDAEALVKISLESPPNVEFANDLKGKWTSTTFLPAGRYLVKVALCLFVLHFFMYISLFSFLFLLFFFKFLYDKGCVI